MKMLHLKNQKSILHICSCWLSCFWCQCCIFKFPILVDSIRFSVTSVIKSLELGTKAIDSVLLTVYNICFLVFEVYTKVCWKVFSTIKKGFQNSDIWSFGKILEVLLSLGTFQHLLIFLCHLLLRCQNYLKCIKSIICWEQH